MYRSVEVKIPLLSRQIPRILGWEGVSRTRGERVRRGGTTGYVSSFLDDTHVGPTCFRSTPPVPAETPVVFPVSVPEEDGEGQGRRRVSYRYLLPDSLP